MAFLFFALHPRLRRAPSPPPLPLNSHRLSYTTHHTSPILHHSSYTTQLTPPISHPPISRHPSYTTHLTPLILLHSTHTTYLTLLILHHSSYTTQLTPPILDHLSHTTHLTPLILHHSSYTTQPAPPILHHLSHTTHLTLLILHHSTHTTYLPLLIIHILHHSSYSTHLTPPILHHSSPHLTPLICLTHLTPLIGHRCLLCVAGAALCAPGVEISWQAQYTEPPGAAAARVVPAGPRLLLEGRFRGRRSTLCTWRADFVAAQYADPPGPSAARVVAVGPRLPFVWRARRSVHLEWQPEQLAAGPRVPFVWQAQRLVNLDRGRRSTQSLRTSCGARGRRWASAAFCVAGAALACVEWRFRGRRSTQRLQEEGFVAGAVTEPFGPAAARVVLGRGCLLCGKRSTWVQISWQAHHSSQTTHDTPIITHSSHTTHHTIHLKPLTLHHSSRTTHHTPLITHHSSYATHHTPLITHHSSHTTHHTH